MPGLGDLVGGGGSFGASFLGGPAGIGLALGANLLGGLLRTHSERSRLNKLKAEELRNLQPLEALLKTRQFGPSAAEGSLMNQAATGTLSDLASRGVLNSSISAPAVAAAVAPYELQRQQQNQGLLERLVSARQAISQGSSLPGYGGAFGETLGQGGELLALMAGRAAARGGQGGGDLAPSTTPDYGGYSDMQDQPDNPIMNQLRTKSRRKKAIGY